MENNPILVVDDDESMRFAVSEALSRSGYQVATAANGREGLISIKQQKPKMVISDYKMPEMNGFELLRSLKMSQEDIPFVMMTAYGEVDDAVKAMKEGAVDFITKPFPLELLENLVKRYRNPGEDLVTTNQSVSSKSTFIAREEKMLSFLDKAKKIARSQVTVLIQGESGTGKEMLARYFHANSTRSDGSFIALNCAAIPETMMESELFGHEKGAFTGAINQRLGKFEMASQGTLLLDEISEMDLSLQAKLLRVLQEFEVDRLGGKKTIAVNTRVITTTNRDLKQMVKDGKFREDLFYRINVFPITIPPLRERVEDIEPLCNHFINKHCQRNNLPKKSLSPEALIRLKSYSWPGNVRELEHTAERAILMCDGEQIMAENLFLENDICQNIDNESEEKLSLKAGVTIKKMERELIVQTLKDMNGNRTHAAKSLDISLRTLRNKIKDYQLENIV